MMTTMSPRDSSMLPSDHSDPAIGTKMASSNSSSNCSTTSTTSSEEIAELDKMKKDDIQTLIEYYRDNPMLWNTTHSQYRNKELKTKVKAELVKRLGNRYSIDVLDKKFHSLRTSMRREVKREAEESSEEPSSKKPRKKPWPYFEVMSFMKDEVLRGLYLIDCTSIFTLLYILVCSSDTVIVDTINSYLYTICNRHAERKRSKANGHD